LASTAVAQPAIPQVGSLFDSFDPNIAAALDGSESPIAALNAVAAAWKQLLASR
jgi:ABC-type glycerol-3-phosphate transport system substrate-binding protein